MHGFVSLFLKLGNRIVCSMWGSRAQQQTPFLKLPVSSFQKKNFPYPATANPAGGRRSPLHPHAPVSPRCFRLHARPFARRFLASKFAQRPSDS